MSVLSKYLSLFALGLFILLKTAHAQVGFDLEQLKNYRSIEIEADTGFMQLDTASIIPASLVLKNAATGVLISSDFYELDWQSGRIKLLLAPQTRLLVAFRVFPYPIKSVYRKKEFKAIDKDSAFYYDPFLYQPGLAFKENPLDFGGLNYNGSFARGVSFGNNQDLVVNSTLDLQLSGNVGDIEILAALTDNNIPIQPDGSTQQIQDFDKVFIQVKKNPHTFIAGDYSIRSNKGYFVKFDKQLQGASYSTGLKTQSGWNTQHSVSFAVAKGKFTRNTFFGVEGNQGPYRLSGNNGETFLIILAGSERVFSDGKLLTRGENNDYIIDYNTGELTFTPSFLMTKDKRIVIEFEYADQNYFRSLIHTGHTANYKKLKLYADVYSEQDSKNRPIQANIDSAGKRILQDIGNNIQNAITSGARTADYDASKVQYRLTDSLVNGLLYDSVFIYSQSRDSQLYELSFSFVGAGAGNYIPDKNALNQRVYRWLEPIDGIPQGSYEPIILIITPKKDQYVAAGMEYQVNAKTLIRSEISLSNRDVNTFSDKDKRVNQGVAALNEVSRRDTLGDGKKWALQSKASYEFKSSNFRPPEQYRPVEFARDWNLFGNVPANEHFAFLKTQLSQVNKPLKVGYSFTTFQRQEIFRGYEQNLNGSWVDKNWDLRGEVRWVTSNDSVTQTSFLRPTFHAGKAFPVLKGLYVATGGFQERNAIRLKAGDTLSNNSFYFNQFYTQVKLPDSAKWTLQLQYIRRADFLPDGKNFSKNNVGNTFEIQGRANSLTNQNLSWNFNFRDLKVLDTLTTSQRNDRNFLGRAEYGFRIKKGAIRYNALYELGSGQERVREFTYLEVQAGQGLYKWLDENNDGLQQLNEFVISQFSDSARFIRVLTNVNEFIQARVVNFNQVFQLNPKAVWFNETGIKKFISRFSVNSSVIIQRKTFKGSDISPFNPFVFNTTDSNVISLNTSFRNSAFFNQGSSKFYINYTSYQNQDKVLLVNGFDTRRRNEHTLENNVNITKILSANLKVTKGFNFYNSDFFDQNDFFIDIWNLEPVVTLVLNTKLRSSAGYSFNNKQNRPENGGELARAHKINFDIRYSKVGKQTLETKFTFANIQYNGINNTTKSYQILEGLQPGQNYIWSLTYDRNLSNNLQLNIGYEGRKTGEAVPVHTGRASIRALF